MSLTTITSEGAFDATVRNQINDNFSAMQALGVGEGHASTHQNGGSDEVATGTPGAYAIPKAGSGGKLASGWIPDLTGTYAKIVAVPAAADSTGAAGQIAYEDGTLYICIATDTWQKVTIATWS